MAVRVSSNNLSDPAIRAAVQEAVLGAIGAPGGDWLVEIHENQYSPSWHITIRGPNDFHWTHEFFGPEEQNSLDGYAFIRKAISDVLLSAPERTQPVVYLSYAYPDNTDGFVNQLRDRLAQELQVQTGEPAEVVWDTERMRPGASWPAKLVERATFLVPVVSPSYLRSDECRKEFEIFLEREQRTKRTLVRPVYFVTAEEVEGVFQPQRAWVQAMMSHNFIDLRPNRFDLTSPRALPKVAFLAKLIGKVPAQFPPEKTAKPVEPIYVESLRLKDFRCFEQLV